MTFSSARQSAVAPRLTTLQGGLLADAVGALAAWVLLGTKAGMPDLDPWYHFLVASEVWRQGGFADTVRLPFTAFGAAGPDPHWLFHVPIAPFTQIPEPALGIRAAAAAAAGLVPAGVYLFLRGRGAPYAQPLALLAFAASPLLPARFLTLRAQTLALVLILAVIWALVRRRLGLLALVSACFMAAYHGAVLVLVITAIFTAILWLRGERLHLQYLGAALVGVTLELVVNPWFPDNVDLLFFHTLFATLEPRPGLSAAEWFPPATARMLRHVGPLLVATAGLLLRDQGVAGQPAAGGAALAAILPVRTLGWWRGHETLTGLRWYRPERSDPVATYVRAPAEAGAMIFNSRWSDFQTLVWQLPDYRFVSGLDGHFLAYGDPSGSCGGWPWAAPAPTPISTRRR